MTMKTLLDVKTPGLLFTRYRLLLHLLFWIGLVLYEGLIWGMVDGAYREKIISCFIELPLKITATYFTLYVLIDKFLVHKKYSAFLFLLIVSMAVFGIVLRLISYYILYPAYYPAGVNMPLFFLPKILIAIFVTYSLVAIVSTFHLIKHYYKNQQAAQLLQQTAAQLEKEKLAAELKLLKSQINPHFLFNTLNNLYALTLNNSAKAPQMVYKLSELMSYMLYDSNQAEVALEKEIHYVKNYIEFEKLRYGERLEVTFNFYGSIDGIMVAPLLMLPFVENSFKHGARNQLHGGWIHIDIEMQEDNLILKVENSKPEFHPESVMASGIGLNNVNKRLDHLYPQRYSLQLFDERDTYMAVLRLSLNKNAIQQAPVTEENVAL
jgi:two-component system, LytTR family, sensor kinase